MLYKMNVECDFVWPESENFGDYKAIVVPALYVAITKNHYGDGNAVYIGCMTDEETLGKILRETLKEAGVELSEYEYPVIVRKGTNDFGKTVRYFMNYSEVEKEISYSYKGHK